MSASSSSILLMRTLHLGFHLTGPPLTSFSYPSLWSCLILMIRANNVKMMFTHLFFLCIFVKFSAESGQILSELKEISGTPSANKEDRFMRLRICHEVFMVQCKPCESMSILNAGYAATRLHRRNPIDGCTELNFQHEFDCLQPSSSRYLEEIKGSCDGKQNCELKRDESSFACGKFGWTWLCCVEINYTCETKSHLIERTFFSAGDTYGNIYVSLQCPSSDLFIDSAVLVFNSSKAVSDGELCYKASANTDHLKRSCEKHGCSGIQVSGARGCGRDEYVFNHGVDVCYICKGSRVSQTTETTQQPSSYGRKTSLILQGNGSTDAEAKNQSSVTTQPSAIPDDGHPTIMPKQNETSVIRSSTTTQTATTAVASSTKVTTVTTKMSLETTDSKIWIDSSSTSPSSTATEFTTASTTERNHFHKVRMLVFSGASLVGGVLMCFIAGCIVFRKRRRTHQTVEIQRIGKLYRNRHLDDEVNEVQTRAESSHRYTYLHGPEEGYQETAEYTYAIDLEDTLKQKGRGAEGRIDDEAGGKSTGNGSGVSIYALQKEEPKRAIEGAPYDCPEPVKLELKINPNLISESKMNLKPVSGHGPKKDNTVLNQPTPKKPKPVYQNADQPKKANVSVYALQKQEPTTMYTEVNRSKQRLKPISEAVDSVTDDLEPGYSLLKKEKPPTFTEVNSSKQKLKPISEAVNSVRDDQVPVYSLMKQEPTPTFTEVNLSKQKLKPISEALDSVRNDKVPVYSLMKQEPTPTFTEVNSSKQKLKPVYKNANQAKSVVEPVYDLLRNPGQDLIPTSKEVSRPTIKPKPCQKVAPYPTKKDSKQFSVPVKKSSTGVTGSDAQAPLPASEGGNKMASSQISYDEEETYDTHKIDTTEGIAVENDLYAEVIT